MPWVVVLYFSFVQLDMVTVALQASPEVCGKNRGEADDPKVSVPSTSFQSQDYGLWMMMQQRGRRIFVLVPVRGRAAASVTWPVTQRRHLPYGKAVYRHMLLTPAGGTFRSRRWDCPTLDASVVYPIIGRSRNHK